MSRITAIMVVFTVGIITLPVCQAHSKHRTSDVNPAIKFTLVPPYGTTEYLRGRIYNANPADYEVAVYILVEGGGWWTKPYFAEPTTTIQSDSTWMCDITTGGSDIYATAISAFLLPNGITPPQAAGLSDLPISLDTIAVASISTVRYGKIILFSGYGWWLKNSSGQVGPGPNYFSDDSADVWVDGHGYLHLKITQRGGNWYCPEVISDSSFGFGKYSIDVGSDVPNLDASAVLGFFTWDNSASENHREIDIEFSQWGTPGDTNAQYVIQPWDQPGNRNRWFVPNGIDSSVHSFDWEADSVSFLSARDDSTIYQWCYRGAGIPSHGNENLRINLWLNNGTSPTDTSNIEVVIKKFEYSPPEVPLPVEMAYYNARVSGKDVNLTWETRSEIQSAGFNILRKESTQAGYSMIASYASNLSLRGLGTSTTGQKYSFTDSKVGIGATYDYEIEQVSMQGTQKIYGPMKVEVISLPLEYSLEQNYPNPFNPTTTIRYQIAKGGLVTLKVYDMLGREVALLVNEVQSAGGYSAEFNAHSLASGIYFYCLTAPGMNQVKKMALMK